MRKEPLGGVGTGPAFFYLAPTPLPTPVFLRRIRSDAGFLAGARDPETLAVRFAERSAAFTRDLREAAARVSLPVLELSGDEAPEWIAELVLDLFSRAPPVPSRVT